MVMAGTKWNCILPIHSRYIELSLVWHSRLFVGMFLLLLPLFLSCCFFLTDTLDDMLVPHCIVFFKFPFLLNTAPSVRELLLSFFAQKLLFILQTPPQMSASLRSHLWLLLKVMQDPLTLLELFSCILGSQKKKCFCLSSSVDCESLRTKFKDECCICQQLA